jgi:predicted DsbA family dithiol-disulfide isomerase
MSNSPVSISYFSDVLCVWAYVAQARLEALKQKFGQNIIITPYHVTLFGDTEQRIGQSWKKKGGFKGFNRHVLEVCEQFPHVELNPEVWMSCVPKSSGNAHLFLKAVQIATKGKNRLEGSDELKQLKQIEWAIRLAFFRDGRDISNFEVLYDIAKQNNLSKASINTYLNDGSAVALFCTEFAMRENYKLEGSPTYVLNESRQKLFGNVGYRIIEANVAELLTNDHANRASWG